MSFFPVFCLSISLCLACTTSLQIEHDESESFDGYASWDWIPGGARTLEAPGLDSVRLDRDLSRLVERELENRGYERRQRQADLRVGALLSVQREEVTVFETGAVEQLSSLHFSPSYQVQASVERKRSYERSRLVVFAFDPRRGKVVWKGVLEARFRGKFVPHVEDTIEALLKRFPPAGPGRRPSAPRRDPGRGDPPLLSSVTLAGPGPVFVETVAVAERVSR